MSSTKVEVLKVISLPNGQWAISRGDDEPIWVESTKEKCEAILHSQYIDTVLTMYEMMHEQKGGKQNG